MKVNYDGHEHEHEFEPEYGLPEPLRRRADGGRLQLFSPGHDSVPLRRGLTPIVTTRPDPRRNSSCHALRFHDG